MIAARRPSLQQHKWRWGGGCCNKCYVFVRGEIHGDRLETHFSTPAAYKAWRLSKSTLEVGRRSKYASKCTTVLEKWVMHNMPHLFLWTQIFSFRILKVLLELCYQLIVIPDHIRVPQKCFPPFLISKHDSSGLSAVFFILSLLQKQGSISMVLSPPCVKPRLLLRPNPQHGERRAGILVLLDFFFSLSQSSRKPSECRSRHAEISMCAMLTDKIGFWLAESTEDGGNKWVLKNIILPLLWWNYSQVFNDLGSDILIIFPVYTARWVREKMEILSDFKYK